MGMLTGCTFLSSDKNEATRSTPTSGQNRSTVSGGTSREPTETPTPALGLDSDYRDDIEFDRVLDGVADLGMDPNGDEPIDPQLTTALMTGTLLELPPGRYLTKERHRVEGIERWGIRGTGLTRAETRILPPEGAGMFFLNFRSGADVLVQNLTFDVRDGRHEWMNNTFKLTDGLRIQDVEYAGFYASEVTGRKVHPASIITGPLHLHITDPDGVGKIDTLVRRGPTHHADYPDGTSCIFVGPEETRGTLQIKNSHIENMSSHGIYASRTRGSVQIENSVFKNNNGAGCRISGPSSYIEDSEIILDADEIVPGTIGDRFNSMTTGMWFESGFRTQAGGRMSDCVVRMGNVPDRVRGIEIDGSAGRTTIENTSISLDGSVVRPVDVNQPGQRGARVRTAGSTPPNPRVNLRNLSITGPAPGPGGAIDLVGRPGSAIENCKLDIASRDSAISFRDANNYLISGTDVRLVGWDGTGLVVRESVGGRITNTSINVPGFPLTIQNGQTPTMCPLRLIGQNRFQSQLEPGNEQRAHQVVSLDDNGCLDPEQLLQDGGKVRIFSLEKGEVDLYTPIEKSTSTPSASEQ